MDDQIGNVFKKCLQNSWPKCHHGCFLHFRRDYEKALQINPCCLTAKVNLAIHLQAVGRFWLAWRQFTSVLSIDAGDQSSLWLEYLNLSLTSVWSLSWQGSHRFKQYTDVCHLSFVVSITEYQPALEGRAIINLQMGDTAAAFQDISASIRVKRSAELLTNRGVIQQVMSDNNCC